MFDPSNTHGAVTKVFLVKDHYVNSKVRDREDELSTGYCAGPSKHVTYTATKVDLPALDPINAFVDNSHMQSYFCSTDQGVDVMSTMYNTCPNENNLSSQRHDGLRFSKPKITDNDVVPNCLNSNGSNLVRTWAA